MVCWMVRKARLHTHMHTYTKQLSNRYNHRPKSVRKHDDGHQGHLNVRERCAWKLLLPSRAMVAIAVIVVVVVVVVIVVAVVIAIVVAAIAVIVVVAMLMVG